MLDTQYSEIEGTKKEIKMEKSLSHITRILQLFAPLGEYAFSPHYLV